MAALYWTKLSIALQDMRCCNEVRALLINELKALYEIDSTIICPYICRICCFYFKDWLFFNENILYMRYKLVLVSGFMH